MKIKKNDTVLVITGKDNGKTGKVLVAYPKLNRISVEGVNIQKRAKKARSAQETSGIVEQCGPIDASNVLVVCPSCKKATRVGHNVLDGKKVRVCKKCGASLDVNGYKDNAKTVKSAKADKTEKAEEVKPVEKKATKTTEKKATEKKTTSTKTTEKKATTTKKTATKKAKDAE